MRIDNTNHTSFGTLYRGSTIKTLLNNNPSKEFQSTLNKTENAIRNRNLHKKDYVDIILNYSKEDGFYGVISSKKQGTPINPAYKCEISTDKKSIDTFTNWVNVWNKEYSPEEIEKYRKLMDFIKNGFNKKSI